MKEHIETFSRKPFMKRMQHYFRVVASENGKTIAQSEGYNNEIARNKAMQRIAKPRGMPMPVVTL